MHHWFAAVLQVNESERKWEPLWAICQSITEKGQSIMKTVAHFIIGILAGALLTTFAFAVASRIISAQDPVKLSPQYYNVLLENDKVRVIEYRLKPGQKEPMHSHPAGIVYFFGNAKLKITSPDGKITESVHTPGETYWRDPVTHALENIGKTEGHAIAVELKCACK